MEVAVTLFRPLSDAGALSSRVGAALLPRYPHGSGVPRGRRTPPFAFPTRGEASIPSCLRQLLARIGKFGIRCRFVPCSTVCRRTALFPSGGTRTPAFRHRISGRFAGIGTAFAAGARQGIVSPGRLTSLPVRCTAVVLFFAAVSRHNPIHASIPETT